MENDISANSEFCTSEPSSTGPSSAEPPSTPSPKPQEEFSARTKVMYFLVGNIVPSLFLMASARNQSLRVSWQSGNFHDYAALLMSAKCGWVFYPLYIYAIACFTIGLLRARQACHSRVVLFGVVTGVLLSVQTCFLYAVVLLQIDRFNTWKSLLLIGIVFPLWGVAAVGLPPFLWWLAKWIYRKAQHFPTRSWFVILCMFTGPVLGVALGLLGEEASNWVIILLFVPAIFVILGSPFWMLFGYTKLVFQLIRLRETRLRYRLADLLGIFAWLGGYLAAWRFAAELAVKTYSELPTTPPSSCYIATAAARGHACVVRSFQTKSATGEVIFANAQLQYLKCGELFLQALFPKGHRRVRQAYDQCGPILASWLVCPLAADIAYAMLKPAEWGVRVLLWLFFPRLNLVVKQLYRS